MTLTDARLEALAASFAMDPTLQIVNKRDALELLAEVRRLRDDLHREFKRAEGWKAENARLRSDEWLEKALTEAWKAGIDGRYGPEAMVMGMMPFLRKHRDGA